MILPDPHACEPELNNWQIVDDDTNYVYASNLTQDEASNYLTRYSDEVDLYMQEMN